MTDHLRPSVGPYYLVSSVDSLKPFYVLSYNLLLSFNKKIIFSKSRKKTAREAEDSLFQLISQGVAASSSSASVVLSRLKAHPTDLELKSNASTLKHSENLYCWVNLREPESLL